jgi:hypothetical protein
LDYFETLVKTVLEREGYWMIQSFKVDLTKEEKRELGRPTTPRPEIDLLAFSPVKDQLMVIEVKSYLDSAGVNLEEFKRSYDLPTGRYKLFTCKKYRQIVFNRIKLQLIESGQILASTNLTLGIAAGKIRRNQQGEFREHMASNDWAFFCPDFINRKLNDFVGAGYENDPFYIAAKVLNSKVPS